MEREKYVPSKTIRTIQKIEIALQAALCAAALADLIMTIRERKEQVK